MELVAVVGMASETNRMVTAFGIEPDERYRTPPDA